MDAYDQLLYVHTKLEDTQRATQSALSNLLAYYGEPNSSSVSETDFWQTVQAFVK